MPRKAPNQVIEHRITFGELERREIKQTLDNYQKTQKFKLGADIGKTAAVTAGAVGIGYLTFLGLGVIGEGLGYVGDVITEVRGKAEEVVFGKKTYPTKNVPQNPDDWVGRDPDTGERINPVSKVPVMGGLVGLGIGLGEGTFGFFTDLDNSIRELIGADPNTYGQDS